jgi:hypothetical protein
MKKTIIFLIFGIFAGPAMAEGRPCESTEQSLQYEISAMGQQRTVEDHVKTARIYAAMAQRGCKDNAESYKQQARASIQTARAMAEISSYNDNEKFRYDSMINKVVLKAW